MSDIPNVSWGMGEGCMIEAFRKLETAYREKCAELEEMECEKNHQEMLSTEYLKGFCIIKKELADLKTTYNNLLSLANEQSYFIDIECYGSRFTRRELEKKLSKFEEIK